MSGAGLGTDYDVLVIGGGVNGAGVARDAALRGLRTVLVDKGDLGAGATGGSSGMIHGGARYLLGDPGVTRTSCQDSGHILRIARHMLFRIPFVMPAIKDRPFPRVYRELTEAFFRAYDKYQPLKGGKRHLRLDAAAVERVLPGLGVPVVGGVTFDEWGVDPYRLVVANALSAAEAGANIVLRRRVERLLITPEGRVYGATVRGPTGVPQDITAKVVVNAAGPWAPRVAAMAGQTLRLRPAKGVHLVLGRRYTNHGVVVQAIDGRSVFLLPHGRHTWIGTTDDDYFGDPDDAEANQDDVEYLLGAVARLLPWVREAPVLDTMVGVRPTLFEWGPDEDDLTRDHRVVDHAQTGRPGLVSLVGGKLASYRLMAEHAVDRVCAILGVTATCRTHLEPLPGARRALPREEIEGLARAHGLPTTAVEAMVRRHGARAIEILDLERPGPMEMVCTCAMVTASEIRYVVRNEWVTDLEGLRHRTGLGTGECGGARCLQRAGAILARELGWSPRRLHEEIHREEILLWRTRRPVAAGSNATRLALGRMVSLAGRPTPRRTR